MSSRRSSPCIAQALITYRGAVETALAVYERTMFSRAEATADSAASLMTCFADDAPRSLVAQFAAHHEQDN
ncbi:hypothetical protein ACWGCW_13505 [Streptomyces sp. NPDC054933]